VAAKPTPLRVVLYADHLQRVALVAPVLRDLGHVVASSLLAIDSEAAESEADVSIVAVESGGPEVIRFVQQLAAAAKSPAVVCLAEADEAAILRLAEASVLTCVVGREAETWRRTVEIVLRPLVEFHELEAGLRRRAVIERAKGVLMERHGAREESAFELIRTEARSTNRRAVDVAQALLDGHQLLPDTHRRTA
jgi:AmiR/NasT family two-component response regulator